MKSAGLAAAAAGLLCLIAAHVNPAGANTGSSPQASSGYGVCLKKTGYGHGYCRGTKGGYQACIDNGYMSSTCKEADLGYQACIAKGRAHASCLAAKGG